ncbi:MAG: STAS domain-containing protein [Planctomycetota bacterium]|jgi:anti-sigma B factor antagonist
MEQTGPRLSVSSQGDVSVVELVEKKILDEKTISEIGDKLYALVGQSDKPRMVLDFANVAHMSSSALGMLITLHKRVREKDGKLRLCRIRPSIYEVFVITRLNEVFTICAEQDEAVGDAARA